MPNPLPADAAFAARFKGNAGAILQQAWQLGYPALAVGMAI
jgi:hypothetical protein